MSTHRFSTHKFAVGETVLYTDMRFPHLMSRVVSKVTACVPSEGVEPRYTVKPNRYVACRAVERELSRPPSQVRSGFLDQFALGHFDSDDAANHNWSPLEQRMPQHWPPFRGEH